MESAPLYWTGAIVALTAAVIHYHAKAFSFWSSRGIKGPTPWPIFGTNIYYLFGHKLDVDRKWREKYGHTFGLYEGYSPLLRTTDNELIKLIYVKNFDSFTDRNGSFIYGDTLNNWLLWSKGPRWSNQRVLVSPMFSSAKMRSMFPTMSQCVDKFINFSSERIKQVGAIGTGNAKPVTFYKQDVSSMTLDVIATCFFSLKLNTYDVSKNEFLRSAYNFATFDLPRFLVWMLVPTFIAKKIEFNLFQESKIDYFYELAKKMIDERRTNKVSKKNDVLQALINAKLPDTYEQVFNSDDDKEAHYNQISHKQLEGVQQEQTQQAKLFKKFTDTEIKGQISFMILAGFETTAATLNFSLFELAHQPKVQERLFDELRAKFGDEAVESGSLKLTKDSYTDLQDLKLLDSFLSEVLRLYSPLLEHNRRVTEPSGFDLPISDSKTIHLPYGTPISTNGFILQRDPDYFEQPDKFDLMRFHPENRHKIKTATFMPFGLGPRHCAGMRFALLEVKLALARLISLYRVTPGPKNRDYPPKIQKNAVFLQFENSDFDLTLRFDRD